MSKSLLNIYTQPIPSYIYSEIPIPSYIYSGVFVPWGCSASVAFAIALKVLFFLISLDERTMVIIEIIMTAMAVAATSTVIPFSTIPETISKIKNT